MSSSTLYALGLLATIASAANHDVNVGEGGFVFNPSSLTAASGDTVTFHFYPGDHAVAQSSFDSPCQPLSNSFFSGYINPSHGESDTTFVIDITNTDPIWMYCPQSGHCQDGMAGVINPPASGDSLDAYISAAANADSASPSAVTGGQVVTAGASPSSSSASSSQAMSSSSMVSSASSSQASTMSSTTSAASSATSSASSASSSSASAASSSASSAASSSPSSAASTSGSATSAAASATSPTTSVVVSTGAASSLQAMEWYTGAGVLAYLMLV